MPATRKILIGGPAGQLEGVMHLPEHHPLALAVVTHPLSTMGGTMDNKVVTTLCKTFVELGYAALRFNFRGVGASPGMYDGGDGEVADVIAVAEYGLREFTALPLILSGFSFGAYVQARAALQLRPQRMILVAPAVGRFAMPDVPSDTLVIHGDRDEVVALDAVMQWAHPQHLPIVIVPEAGHFFHGRLADLKQLVRTNLTEHPL